MLTGRFDFPGRGLKNVSLIDLNSTNSQVFSRFLATDPVAIFAAYPGKYDAQFCAQVPKTLQPTPSNSGTRNTSEGRCEANTTEAAVMQCRFNRRKP
jgi:hypothetical protein